MVRKLRKLIEKKLAETDSKVTTGDLIRMMQMEKELVENEPLREITVTWVEPGTAEESEGT